MSKACLNLILMCIVAVPFIFSPSSVAVQTSANDILTGRSIPKSWESAPAEITLPQEWQKTIRELAEETEATQLEKGACLAFGRSAVEQVNLASLMIKLGELNLQIKAAQKAGESTKAIRMKAEETRLKKALERGGSSEIHNVFEVQRTSQGIHGSVHIPSCIGSQLGTIHTHPPGSIDFAMPSDGDTAYYFYKFIIEHHKLEIVARNETVALVLVTQNFLDKFSKKDGFTESKYGEADVAIIRQLTNLIEQGVFAHERKLNGYPAGVIKRTDSIAVRELSVLAAFLKPYGAVLYYGDIQLSAKPLWLLPIKQRPSYCVMAKSALYVLFIIPYAPRHYGLSTLTLNQETL